MRELAAALLSVARALLSYVVPIRFETRTTRPALASDRVATDTVTVVTVWELRRGEPRPVLVTVKENTSA